jgi:hypothetical protein
LVKVLSAKSQIDWRWSGGTQTVPEPGAKRGSCEDRGVIGRDFVPVEKRG